MSSSPFTPPLSTKPGTTWSLPFSRQTPTNRHQLRAVKEVFMPALSSTMTEGKIVSWLKGEGDKVAKGEPIVVVESDKADMDVECFNAGFLGSIVVPDGGVANVGEAIAFIAETEAELEEAKSKSQAANGSPGAGAPAPAPAAAAPQPAAAPVESPPAAAPPAEPTPAPAPVQPVAAAPVKRADGRVIATPYAKKLAKELGVDLGKIAGTGPAGRITAGDVESAKNGVAPVASPVAAPASSPDVAPAVGAARPDPVEVGTTVGELRGKTVPFNALQKAVATGMVESLAVPEFRVAATIDVGKFDALYKRLKGHGVTMTALLAKACGVALAEHPVLFASCTKDGAGITYNESVNVAVAVAMSDGGLITPVLKNADSTDIYTMSREWGDLVKRARAKKLKPDEFSSGTFTISNLGMFGVDSFDAILPVGTAAILAIGGSKNTVVATDDGLIGVKKLMTVNITCDHRIVYGADAAKFLQSLKQVIENPDELTL